MAFRCPSCQFRVTPKVPPRPGRYTPTCPRCKAQIILTVPADKNAEWRTTIPIDALYGAETPEVLLKAAAAVAGVGFGGPDRAEEPTDVTGDSGPAADHGPGRSRPASPPGGPDEATAAADRNREAPS